MKHMLGLMVVVILLSAHASARANDVAVFGANIHYVERGTGPAVILIHGLGDNTEVWRASVEALSTTHRVIAFDQLGFGQSAKPLMAYRVGTLVDFLSGFLDALHIDHASLVGNSLGGWVALEFARLHPQRVDRLVLVDCVGYSAWPSADVANALRLATRADFQRLLPLTFFDSKALMAPTSIDDLYAQHVAAGDGYAIQQILDSAVRGEDVLDGRVSAIQKPALIIWGRGDRLVPLALGQRLHRELRGSRLEVIEQCGHMPQVECPAAFNERLLAFLRRDGQIPAH
jgi:pimeloyl-ACP methyl ester carboxylesterase